jgi:hypothetical protein
MKFIWEIKRVELNMLKALKFVIRFSIEGDKTEKY